MPADESTAEVSRLLEQWDSINNSPLQLSAILAADSVLDMGCADGDVHLVAVLARLLLFCLHAVYVVYCLVSKLYTDKIVFIIIIINEEIIVAFSHRTTRTRYKVKTQNRKLRCV